MRVQNCMVLFWVLDMTVSCIMSIISVNFIQIFFLADSKLRQEGKIIMIQKIKVKGNIHLLPSKTQQTHMTSNYFFTRYTTVISILWDIVHMASQSCLEYYLSSWIKWSHRTLDLNSQCGKGSLNVFQPTTTESESALTIKTLNLSTATET